MSCSPFTSLKDILGQVSSREWLWFLRRGGSATCQRHVLNARASNVPQVQRVVVVVASFIISLTFQMWTHFSKPFVLRAEFSSYFFRNSTVSLILLSNAGAVQRMSIGLTLNRLVKTIWRTIPSPHWNPFPYRWCASFRIDPYDLWMHMVMGWMGGRQHGHRGSTVCIEFCPMT